MAFIVVVAGAIWIADIKSWAVVVAVMFFAFLIAATIEWFSFFAEEPRGSPMAGWGAPAPASKGPVATPEPGPVPIEPVPPATGAEPGGDRSRRRFPLRRRLPARETHDRIPPRPELVPPSAPTAPIAPEPSPAPGEPA